MKGTSPKLTHGLHSRDDIFANHGLCVSSRLWLGSFDWRFVAGAALQEGGVQLFAFKATFDAVSSKQELLQLVNISPLGLKEPAEKDTYNGVR